MKVKLLQYAICKRVHSEFTKCQSTLGLSRRCFSFFSKQCTSTLMLFRRAFFFVAVQPSRHAHLVTSPEDDGIAQLRPQPLRSREFCGVTEKLAAFKKNTTTLVSLGADNLLLVSSSGSIAKFLCAVWKNSKRTGDPHLELTLIKLVLSLFDKSELQSFAPL